MNQAWLIVLTVLTIVNSTPTPYDSDHHQDCPDMRGILPDPSKLRDIVQGFTQGLRAESARPSACFNATEQVTLDFVQLYSTAVQVINGNSSIIFNLLGEYGRMVQDFEDVQEDCEFDELWITVEKLISPTGMGVLYLRYAADVEKFTKDLEAAGKCAENLRECGTAAGEMLRLLIDWGI